MRKSNRRTWLLAWPAALLIQSCGSSGTDALATDRAPIITGMPPPVIKAGQTFVFQPDTIDESSNQLTYSISNLPVWASFDHDNGQLTGTPWDGHEGLYDNISIYVSDGRYTSALRSFSIEVVNYGNLSVTLSWLPPTENEDGSPLFDLSGYKVHYGSQSGLLPNIIDIPAPGLSAYFVDGLVPGTYYFKLTAYNRALRDGVPSRRGQHKPPLITPVL